MQQSTLVALAFLLFALALAAAVTWGGRKGTQPAINDEVERLRRRREWERAQREYAAKANPRGGGKVA